jgi:hypothetical protein
VAAAAAVEWLDPEPRFCALWTMLALMAHRTTVPLAGPGALELLGLFRAGADCR